MPSDAFFRLPDVKREHLIQVLQEEIERAGYEGFSIPNVLRRSGISRGSFYQYFQNKDEIFLYLTSCYYRDILQYTVRVLEENGGDFFDAMEQSYRYAVRMLLYKESSTYRRNLFCNPHVFELLWKPEKRSEGLFVYLDKVRSIVDRSRLNVESTEEFNLLYGIVQSSAMKGLINIFLTRQTEEVVLADFLSRLALLKKKFEK
ncbi:MAG: TetR/AcrR family transcriptional regulator [Oscillospiraceae bacterium]|nr:TetR/AcrR family transcriptional regulator [Oscillospiraceae bacterium]